MQSAPVSPRADHDDVLALRRQEVAVLEVGVEQALGVAREEVHREMDAGELVTARRRAGRIERHGRSGGQHERVEVVAQRGGVDEAQIAVLQHDLVDVAGREVLAAAHVYPRDEGDALLAQQIDPPVDDVLAELHVGDAVHQQAADAVGALVDGHVVADRVQLVGAGQAGGAAADDGDALAGSHLRRARHDPALLEPAVDDRVLDVLDRDRRLDDPQHAGALAGGGAGATGELGEVVGLVQTVQRLAPAAPVHEVVPLGDQVVDGAPCLGLAKGHAAVHAARALSLEPLLVGLAEDLFVVAEALGGVAVGDRVPRELLEAGGVAHQAVASSRSRRSSSTRL